MNATSLRTYLPGVICAATICAMTFGLRQTVPMYMADINLSTGVGLVAISFAFGIGQLAWGLAQPVGGAISDRLGTEYALIIGIVLSIAGTLLIPHVSSPIALVLTIGVLSAGGAGFAGLAVLMSAVNRIVPKERAGIFSGIVNAGGSVGQFLLTPLAGWLIVAYDWRTSILVIAVICSAALPLAWQLRGKNTQAAASGPDIGFGRTLKLAFGTPSYLMLNAGFFVCGFHVAFIGTHMPGVISLCGLPPTVTGWALALLGAFNLLGSLAAGWLITRFSMRLLLSMIYASRGVIVLLFLLAPKTEMVILIFAAALGASYLSTVPPTAGLVARMFGPKYMGTLFGIVIMVHQVGGFLGAYLGGVVMNRTGSYDWMWYADIALAAFAALIHLPIRETAVPLPEPAAARA